MDNSKLDKLKASVRANSKLVFVSQTEAKGIISNSVELLEVVEALELEVQLLKDKLYQVNQN